MRAVESRRARLPELLAAQAAAASPGPGAPAIANCRAYALREPFAGRQYSQSTRLARFSERGENRNTREQHFFGGGKGIGCVLRVAPDGGR